jgi:hypothetical protein
VKGSPIPIPLSPVRNPPFYFYFKILAAIAGTYLPA